MEYLNAQLARNRYREMPMQYLSLMTIRTISQRITGSMPKLSRWKTKQRGNEYLKYMVLMTRLRKKVGSVADEIKHRHQRKVTVMEESESCCTTLSDY